MTGIISAYALILIVGQLQQPPAFGNPASQPSNQSAPSSVEGVSDGWALDDRNGSLSYIVQLSPERANQIATEGKEVQLLIPKDLQGIAQNVVIRIGNGPVERDLSPDQLMMRQRERTGDTRSAGVGNLNSLSSRPSGEIVPIDNTRIDTPILPAGNNTKAARSTANDLAMQSQFPSPPSLGASLARDGYSRDTLPPASQPKSVLPPGYSDPSGIGNSGIGNSGGGTLAGRQTPGYTGGGVTVEGTSVTDEFGRPQYSANPSATNPFRSGTYGGNGLNSPTSNLQNNQGLYGQPNYGQSGSLNTNGGFNSVTSAPIQYAPNQAPIPSLNLNPFQPNNAYGQNGQLISSQSPASSYLPSQPAYQQTPLIAQANSQNAISASEYTLKRQFDELSAAYNKLSANYKNAPPSAAFQIFMIISIAINLYALWQLSNLYTSYRALQLSKRAEGAYGFDVT